MVTGETPPPDRPTPELSAAQTFGLALLTNVIAGAIQLAVGPGFHGGLALWTLAAFITVFVYRDRLHRVSWSVRLSWLAVAGIIIAVPSIIVVRRSLVRSEPVSPAARDASRHPNPQGAVLAESPRPPLPTSYRLKVDEVPLRSKLVLCEKPANITPEAIWEDGRNRSAYDEQYKDAWLKYKHQCVKWRLPLQDWRYSSDDLTDLTFASTHPGVGIIGVQVRSEDYPELRLGPYEKYKNALFDIQGKIIAVDERRIVLRDVVMSMAPGP